MNCPNIKAWYFYQYRAYPNIGQLYFPKLEYLRMVSADGIRKVSMFAPLLKSVYLESLFELRKIELIDDIHETSHFKTITEGEKLAEKFLQQNLPIEIVKMVMNNIPEKREKKITTSIKTMNFSA